MAKGRFDEREVERFGRMVERRIKVSRWIGECELGHRQQVVTETEVAKTRKRRRGFYFS